MKMPKEKTMPAVLALVLGVFVAAGCSNEPDVSPDPASATDTGSVQDVGSGLGEDDAGGMMDLASRIDASEALPDVGEGGDAGADMLASEPCSRTSYDGVNQFVFWDGANNYRFSASIRSEAGLSDRLYLEIYPDDGGFIGPQSFEFTGENYQDCSTCLQIHADCPQSGDCGKRFLAQSGSVEVIASPTTEGEAFEAVFRDLRLAEVTVEALVSTVVPDGESYCIPSLVANAAVTTN